MAHYGRRLLTFQELKHCDGRISKRDLLYIGLADWERQHNIKKRRPQRSWKKHRKTKYHRLAGMSHKEVIKTFGFLVQILHRTSPQ